tara:strand:+ start:1560 stop:2462 length:903 start_codon:yes stop_codon:yes gene_type:complete
MVRHNFFNIEGTISSFTNGRFLEAKPIPEAINHLNCLYNAGHEIILYRFIGSSPINEIEDLTINQLKNWSVKFTKLLLPRFKGDLPSNYFVNSNLSINNSTNNFSNNYFSELSNNFSLLHNDPLIYNIIDLISDEISSCFNNKGKIFFAGNGGSFADAQHIAAEFTSKITVDRAPLPAILLGANSSSLTAISNDYGYEHVFSRELDSLASENDMLIALTTSGESKNIITLLNHANYLNLKSWCITSAANSTCSQISRCLQVPKNVKSVFHIQELHIAIGHFICLQTESKYFSSNQKTLIK